jgi:hypothetical protein
MLSDNCSNEFGGRAWNFDGVLEQAAELVTPLFRTHADTDAEVVAFEIPTDERFGEDNKLCLLAGGICCEVGEFLK